MPIFLAPLIALGIKCVCAAAITGGACYCVKKVSDAVKKGQKNKQRRLELKGKSLEEAREDNKKAREEEKKLKEELEEQERKNKELEKDLEQAKQKMNDLSLSEEERAQWRRKVIFLEDQLNDGRNNRNTLLDRIKGITKRIKNNSEVISGIGLNTSERHWVWDLFTLENIIIAGACYVAYRILKEEK